MKTPHRFITGAALALTLCAAPAAADEVVTVDGSVITGTITSIDEGVIKIDTGFAGEIEIQQDQVATFTTDEPRNIRFESGATMTGVIAPEGTGNVVVTAPEGTLSAGASNVSAAWGLDETDPEVLRNQRKWRYEAGANILGTTGTTEEFGIGLLGVAELKGPDDTLRIFGDYEYREQNGEKSADRAKGGGSYTNFFYGDLGWYVRTEIEYNDVQFISFRSTTAAGLDYRFLNEDHWTLNGRAGLGYRNTTYTNATPDESTPTLDLGISHMYRFNDTFRMLNDLTYTPSLEEFADYIILHESSIEMPIGTGDYWFLRMGIRNEYNSRPAIAAENLDTTYFARLLLTWE